MNAASSSRPHISRLVALNDNAFRRPSPPFGMEALERMGIDIDQDPRAFAKFLELKNQARGGKR